MASVTLHGRLQLVLSKTNEIGDTKYNIVVEFMGLEYRCYSSFENCKSYIPPVFVFLWLEVLAEFMVMLDSRLECKVDVFNSDTYPNQPPIFEWYVFWCGPIIGTKKARL